MSPTSSHIEKLTKAPLQEVIFEAFWELDIDSQTRESYDPGFELAQGVFTEAAKEKFPIYKRVAPSMLPVRFLLHKPIHQFWRGEGEWPVIQLGPGILAANDTEKTYVWENGFRPVIEDAIANLIESYIEAPRFNKVSLRYIDAVELEGKYRVNFAKFIETNLQVRVVRNFEVEGDMSEMNLSQVYALPDGSQLHIVISNGQRNNRPAVVWQTAVVRASRFSVDEIKAWVSHSHLLTSDLFKRMCQKEFYDSLR